jgi:hypothetical protein
MSINSVTFPILKPDIFKQLITFTNHYTSTHMTRHSSTTAHGCSNTQFIYICSCILEIDVNFNKKSRREIEQILNSYANKISNVKTIIINSNRQSRNKMAMFNSVVDEDIITKINGINDVSINSFTYYKYEDFYLIPLCMYFNNPGDPSTYIAHYFTLIIDHVNNTCHINSSYGSDEICVLTATKQIDMNKINRIITKINHDSFDRECEEFIKEYFLPNIKPNLYENEISTLRRSYVGLINNYIYIITKAIIENPELQIGGKKTRQIKKYKTKKYKTKKNKTKKNKTKKIKQKNIKNKKQKI